MFVIRKLTNPKHWRESASYAHLQVHETCGRFRTNMTEADHSQSRSWTCMKCPAVEDKNLSIEIEDQTPQPTLLDISHFNAIMEQFANLNSSLNACNKQINTCNKQINTCNKEINTCNKQIETISSLIASHSESIEKCIINIKDLQNENAALQRKITTLENQVSSKASINTTEIYHEISERIRRENNVIVMGAPEETDATKDKSLISAIISSIAPDIAQHIKTTVRLGDPTKGSRPVKVVLRNKEDALTILRNKSRIPKQLYPAVFVKQDITPNQRKTLQKLRKELDARTKSGEIDLTIKYINKEPKIVQKEPDSSSKRPRETSLTPQRPSKKPSAEVFIRSDNI